MLIQRCDRDEAPQISDVIKQASAAYEPIFGSDFSASDYMPLAKVMSEMNKMTFYASKLDGMLFGVIGYQPLGEVALIRHVYVLGRYQRQNIGTRLLKYVEDLAALDGFDRILVGTYKGADWAINFYRRHGFMPVENSQALLTKFWDISARQAEISTVLEKKLKSLLRF